MASTLTPLEQLTQDIADLDAQRNTLYDQFAAIEATLQQKRKLVDAFQLVKDSTDLQQSLITEMKTQGMLPN